MENSGKIRKKILNFVKSLKNRQIQTNFYKYILPREMKYEKNLIKSWKNGKFC